MSNVSGEYNVEDLLVPREHMLERLADPLGGVALIETGVDVTSLLRAVGERADEISVDTASEKQHIWGREIEPHPAVTVGGLLFDADFSEYQLTLDELSRELAAIEPPLKTALQDTTCSMTHRGADISLFAIAMRRSFLRETHVDRFGQITLWLGASQPGLRLLVDGVWRDVPTVPPAHALVWRQSDAYHDGKRLEPTPHYARYRSRKHRAILIS